MPLYLSITHRYVKIWLNLEDHYFKSYAYIKTMHIVQFKYSTNIRLSSKIMISTPWDWYS